MSKNTLFVGLVATVLVSLVVGALATPARADYVPYQGTLSCWSSASSVNSGQSVTFGAYYSGGYSYPYSQLTWSAPGAYPSTGTGTSFSTTFWSSDISRTYTVTVTDGMQTTNCSVTVYPTQPSPYPTPTLTPYPGSLQCSPAQTWALYGQDVTLNAWGGNNVYTWSAPEGNPSSGTGSTFKTRYYNTSGSTRNYTVSVSTYDTYYGTRTSNCTVTVPSYSGSTPTPTPYYGTGTVSLTMTGRNVSRGQSSRYTTVAGSPGDTVDLFLHVKARGYLTGVWTTDYLPAGLSYVPGSTTLNGYVVADGVTTTGLYVGTLADGQEATIKFSATVQNGAVPTAGSITVYDNAQTRADGTTAVSARIAVTLGSRLAIAQISTVKTGPTDSLVYALSIAVLMTGMYALYTRSPLFAKRTALAEIGRLSRQSDLNFSR